MIFFVSVLATVVLANWSIPLWGWAYGFSYYKISLREFLQRYGAISTPRALTGALTCAVAAVRPLFPSIEAQIGIVVMGLFALFGFTALVEVLRIKKD